MTLQEKLNAMKRWTPAKLNARCPVKPIRPPARFDFNRKWPTFIPGYKGVTVAQFCAQDAYADILGATSRAAYARRDLRAAGTVAEYIAAWDAARHLKPAMVILYPSAEGRGEPEEMPMAA